MEAVIGLALGIVATVLVSRYYFLRSVDKSLSVFGLLNANVFAGIARDMRKNLHFIFQDKEVEDLQQVVLLIANDGERAISNVIEPLSIQLPNGVDVLDASVLHRHPESLKASITHKASTAGAALDFIFPLLNKGEFFVVKLLLSGNVSVRDIPFTILADDLPRSLKVKRAPPASLQDSGYKVQWELVVVSLVILVFPLWALYMLHLLWKKQPELFPYPWESFVVSMPSLLLTIPGALLLGFLLLLGIGMLGAAFFNGQFPPNRRPRFPLPKEIRNMGFPYRMPPLPPSFGEDDHFDMEPETAADV